MKSKWLLVVCFLFMLMTSGCTKKNSQMENQPEKMKQWVEKAQLDDKASAEELYEAALLEDSLIIYSVSSRVFDVKEQFEKEYPGLTVEIKDVRGDDIINMLLANYENEDYACDLVLCSDCDGSLNNELLEKGIVYPYLPWDIVPKMKAGHAERELVFLGETLMLFYNETIFNEQPIQNLWELTEEKYCGKIIMANPLSSFTTFGYCATIFSESDLLEKAYEEYADKPLTIPENECAGEVFWEKVSPNIVFTNSSDEVLEGIGGKGKEDMWIGIMLSSKMRYQNLGYQMAPIYQMEPFAGVYTPNSITIAGGAKNVNSAKLFIRYLVGETEGTGEGAKPFATVGTWSTRIDVADGNPVPLSEINVVDMDRCYIYEHRDMLLTFWKNLLKESVGQ